MATRIINMPISRKMYKENETAHQRQWAQATEQAKQEFSYDKDHGWEVQATSTYETYDGMFMAIIMWRTDKTDDDQQPPETSVTARRYVQPDPGYLPQTYVFAQLVDPLAPLFDSVNKSLAAGNIGGALYNLANITANLNLITAITGDVYKGEITKFRQKVSELHYRVEEMRQPK